MENIISDSYSQKREAKRCPRCQVILNRFEASCGQGYTCGGCDFCIYVVDLQANVLKQILSQETPDYTLCCVPLLPV